MTSSLRLAQVAPLAKEGAAGVGRPSEEDVRGQRSEVSDDLDLTADI